MEEVHEVKDNISNSCLHCFQDEVCKVLSKKKKKQIMYAINEHTRYKAVWHHKTHFWKTCVLQNRVHVHSFGWHLHTAAPAPTVSGKGRTEDPWCDSALWCSQSAHTINIQKVTDIKDYCNILHYLRRVSYYQPIIPFCTAVDPPHLWLRTTEGLFFFFCSQKNICGQILVIRCSSHDHSHWLLCKSGAQYTTDHTCSPVPLSSYPDIMRWVNYTNCTFHSIYNYVLLF